MKLVIKSLRLFLTGVIVYCFFLLIVNAETITISIVNANRVNIRTGAGVNHPNIGGNNPILLSAGHKVTVVGSKNDGDGFSWYCIDFVYDGVSKNGYIRSDFITETAYELVSDPSFENYLIDQGFPSSYWPKLKELHAIYPNWVFKALHTGLNWNEVINAQSAIGKSLIYYSRDVAYRSTEMGAYNSETDTWVPLDGTSWYAAHPDVVAYHVDPRNFLTPTTILMFEALNYQSAYQTKAVVQRVLDGTFMANSYSYNGNLKSYADTFIEAASLKGVSPIHLASRVRQEQGVNGSSSVTGGVFSYNGKTYSGLYNFFNIGATSGADNWKKGLVYANGGENGVDTSYGRPWYNPYSSIVGGAEFVGYTYINRGQNTLYLQKWNVGPDAFYTKHTHQYMTNIEAPKSESGITYNAYLNYGILNNPLVFIIPIYNTMPLVTNLPNSSGNSNNYLTNITINGLNLASFNQTVLEYTVYLPSAVTNVSIDAIKASSKASIVSGGGNISLKENVTVSNIVVKAENGVDRVYKLTIIKSDDAPISVHDIVSGLKWNANNGFLSGIALNTSVNQFISNINQINQFATVKITSPSKQAKTTGNIVTGDVVTIVSNNESHQFTALVYGNIKGEDQITIKDLLMVQRHLLKVINLTGVHEKAADVDRDGQITIKDLLIVQRHLLGINAIKQ